MATATATQTYTCELLDKCGFFKKYCQSLDLACQGFMNSFCKGPKMDDCVRKAFRKEHGCPPDDDMLPTGQMMPKKLGGHR